VKQSAGIILLDMTSTKEPRVLCLRAFKNWDFPKGRLEPEESVTYGSGKQKKTATYFYAALVNLTKAPTLPVNPQLGKPEHDEWRWVPVSRLPDLLPKRLQNIAQKISSYFLSAGSQNSH
jgi:bis(5'-nucleosidyl)-tetraphosphatase